VQRGSHGSRERVRRAEVKRRKPKKPALVTLQTGEANEGEEPWDGTVISRENTGLCGRQAVEGSGRQASDGLVSAKRDGQKGEPFTPAEVHTMRRRKSRRGRSVTTG
jgi:hypothetical protein